MQSKSRAPDLREMYSAIGAAVVGGGQIEFQMQRLLLFLQDRRPADIATAIKTWSYVESQIRKEASARGLVEVIETLDQAERDRLKVVRDNIVHAYWWTLGADSASLRASRHMRNGRAPVPASHVLSTSTEQLRDAADQLFAFADALARHCEGDGWPTVGNLNYLPP